jgi:hypothetical protein
MMMIYFHRKYTTIIMSCIYGLSNVEVKINHSLILVRFVVRMNLSSFSSCSIFLLLAVISFSSHNKSTVRMLKKQINISHPPKEQAMRH